MCRGFSPALRVYSRVARAGGGAKLIGWTQPLSLTP